MVDLSLFPTAGEIARSADKRLAAMLDPLPRPLTWKIVAAALNGQKWHAHATFDDEFYHSQESGDFVIRVPDCFVGYCTGEGGIEPMDGYYVRPDGKGGVVSDCGGCDWCEKGAI